MNETKNKMKIKTRKIRTYILKIVSKKILLNKLEKLTLTFALITTLNSF